MSEVEKEESKKTVVAFITGLLIGGLLVWVFSSTPTPEKKADTANEDTKGEVSKADVEKTLVQEDKVTEVAVGEGSLKVLDQKAGKLVTLGTLGLPSKNGWVVVRDYMDGVPGNVLGAARYSTDEGLIPTAVELVRVTTAGSSYQVVFFTNEGAPEFKTGEDKPVDGASATFKAN